jgi:hypothetical protein
LSSQSSVVKRLVRDFLKDHPTGALRSQVTAFLEDVEAHLTDGSMEAEEVRARARRIRSEHKLGDTPRAQVDDFELLLKQIEAMRYDAPRDVQEPSRHEGGDPEGTG